MALYNWQYIKELNDTYPEVFYLKTPDSVDIRILYNGKKKTVRIRLDFQEQSIVATIAHGIIVKEEVIDENKKNKKSQNLQRLISLYSTEIGTVPSQKVLDLINGNYNVNKDFKGKTRLLSSRTFITGGIFQKDYWSISNLFYLIKNKILSFIRALLILPQLIDIMDGVLICFVTYLIYWYNYDLVVTGISLILLSFFFVFYDLLRRSRGVYLPKFFVALILGCFLLFLSVLEQ